MFVQNFVTVVIVLGHDGKCTAIIQEYWDKPTKYALVRPEISCGNCYYSSLLKVVKLFLLPFMHSACMNNVVPGVCSLCMQIILDL